MELLPYDIRVTLPPLYATEHEPDPLARVKLFTSWTNWTWYLIEYDGQDLAFGLVHGFEVELGYFSMGELRSIRGPHGLKIERDLHFEPTAVAALRERLQGR
ncbi:MAG: DUF2958 domain-containing protein [Phycisphaerales bacterium]